jgi:Uma2 family endonuclease
MSDMALEYKLREFTVEEFHRMAETGVLRREERVELLDGAIVEMSPIGERHWDRHSAIVEYLIAALGEAARVAGQASLRLGDRNEPQPDIAVLRRRSYSRASPPAPAEIFAIVEIADSSLAKDTGPKQRLYGRFGVADYLVVDLDGDVLRHYRDPHELGYRQCDVLRHGDTFELVAAPGQRLSADPFLENRT